MGRARGTPCGLTWPELKPSCWPARRPHLTGEIDPFLVSADPTLTVRRPDMTTIEPAFRTALTGISGILVTPFDEQDRIVPNRLKPIIDRAVNAGVHILVANGNTGEFYGLTTAEAEAMVHAVAEQIAG